MDSITLRGETYGKSNAGSWYRLTDQKAKRITGYATDRESALLGEIERLQGLLDTDGKVIMDMMDAMEEEQIPELEEA